VLLHELRIRLRNDPLSRGCTRLRVRLPSLQLLLRIRVHGRLNLRRVQRDIIQNTLLDRPTEKVELAHRRHEGRRIHDLEHDTLPTAKGIKELLTVCLQLRLVVRIDEELLAIQNIGGAILLRVVRDEPVNEAQRHLGRAVEQPDDFCLIGVTRIKPLQGAHYQFLLAVDLLATSLRIGFDWHR